MAPTKSTRALSKQISNTTVAALNGPLVPLARKGVARRTTLNTQDQNVDIIQTRGKRKAEASPAKNDKIKRSALGNLTNNVKMVATLTGVAATGTLHPEVDAKHSLNIKKDNQQHHGPAHVLKDKQNVGSGTECPTTRQQHCQHLPQQQQQQEQNKITTRATARNAQNVTVLEEKKTKVITARLVGSALPFLKQHLKEQAIAPAAPPPPSAPAAGLAKAPLKPVRRISNEFNKTEESLYMSALEEISSSESLRFSGNFEAAKRRSALLQQEKIKTEDVKPAITATVPGITVKAEAGNAVVKVERTKPEGVDDFDKANWNDPFQVSHYAFDIFEYMKSREQQFRIPDYISTQTYLSKWMRSLLVDWMVEVQETFELNHETLYLAVKLVDLYLSRVVINKDKLQLLGAAALFIACKFDERTPPLIEDFLYICDGAYKHDELIHMEMATLRTIDYDLGIPLSYRFLRRYARCAKISMPTLTLARFILELSLMDYATVQASDSKLACAVLFMALRLEGKERPWSPTLEYYTSYKLTDFAELVPILNAGMHRRNKGAIKTIRNKYSHKIFHEVATVALMSTEKLFENNLDLNNGGQAVTKIEPNNS